MIAPIEKDGLQMGAMTMTKDMTVVLPAEMGAEATAQAKDKAKTIATATGSILAAGGRRLCDAIASYADAAASAHVAPFDILSAAARKDRKPFD
jgi:hypothetical protein